jgi:hypothetical protein
MKYSLRSLMIVAILAPALLAGVYCGIRLLISLEQTPRLEVPERPPPAIPIT